MRKSGCRRPQPGCHDDRACGGCDNGNENIGAVRDPDQGDLAEDEDEDDFVGVMFELGGQGWSLDLSVLVSR
jgi:hypothetical protein